MTFFCYMWINKHGVIIVTLWQHYKENGLRVDYSQSAPPIDCLAPTDIISWIWLYIENTTFFMCFSKFCVKKHFSAWKHVVFMFYQVLCKKGKIHAKSTFLLENTVFCPILCKKARNVEKTGFSQRKFDFLKCCVACWKSF